MSIYLSHVLQQVVSQDVDTSGLTPKCVALKTYVKY